MALLEQAYLVDLHWVADKAIQMRDQGLLTNGDLVVLANMIEFEFRKPVVQWKTTPGQLFNCFLEQRNIR